MRDKGGGCGLIGQLAPSRPILAPMWERGRDGAVRYLWMADGDHTSEGME